MFGLIISILAILVFVALGEYCHPYRRLGTWVEKWFDKHGEPVMPKELNDLAERMTQDGQG